MSDDLKALVVFLLKCGEVGSDFHKWAASLRALHVSAHGYREDECPVCAQIADLQVALGLDHLCATCLTLLPFHADPAHDPGNGCWNCSHQQQIAGLEKKIEQLNKDIEQLQVVAAASMREAVLVQQLRHAKICRDMQSGGLTNAEWNEGCEACAEAIERD